MNNEAENTRGEPLRIVIGGIIALMIAMGIGRFAYTPILPAMQAGVHLSDATSGYLASSNYLGYLLGAFFVGAMKWKKTRVHHLRIHLLLNTATTAAMGLTSSLVLWLIFRFVSGVTSGFIFVLASSIVLDVLATHGRLTWSGIYYAGTGLGIFIAGLLVPVLITWENWRGAWLGMGLLSLCASILPWVWLREAHRKNPAVISAPSTEVSGEGSTSIFPWLVAAYGCEGLGYIVSGTFLVAVAERIPGLQGFAGYSWVLVGLASMPSCVIWAWVAKKWGFVRSLILAYTVQMVGVVLPAVLPNTVGVYVGSILFGGTFMGITTVATTAGRMLHPNRSSQAIGYMTGVYGVGQIIGPVGTGILVGMGEGYRLPLVLSGGVLLVGVCLLLIGQARSSNPRAVHDVSA
jgi:MFS family permease